MVDLGQTMRLRVSGTDALDYLDCGGPDDQFADLASPWSEDGTQIADNEDEANEHGVIHWTEAQWWMFP